MTKTTSRRTFLRQATTAAMVPWATQYAQMAHAAPASKVIVGAHPWVYAAKLPDHDITPKLPEIFADMKWAGMDGIELMHTALLPDDAVVRIGALSAEHDLPVLGTSFGANMWDRTQHAAILDEAEVVLTRLAALGGTTLGTSVGNARRKKTESELDAQAEILREIIALAQSRGITLNLHNHTYEVEHDMHDLRGTLARVPDAKLGPDLDWLVQADVDPLKFLRTFGSQIVFLHLRDQRRDKTWVEAMGEGDMDYRAIGRVLREIDFQGHAVIELAHPRDLVLTRPLRESLKISRQYVRETLNF